MKKDIYKLPEKWCIYLDKENIEELTNFYMSHINEYDGCSSYIITVGNTFHYPQHEKHAHSWSGDYVIKGYTKITFQQFKNYVLMETDAFDDLAEIIEEDLTYLIQLFKDLNIK